MKGEAILAWLHQDADPQKPLVVMMCGVAGAGKTTLAKQLEAAGYLRLSIDEEVWRGLSSLSLCRVFSRSRGPAARSAGESNSRTSAGGH